MNRSIRVVWLFVAAAIGAAHAQGRGAASNPDLLPIFEVVGCLSQSPSDWILTNATEPAPAPTSFTTPEAMKEAADKPLGLLQYRLLGTTPYNPTEHKGHKIAVRGLLIKNGNETRINVTSFQMVGQSCAK